MGVHYRSQQFSLDILWTKRNVLPFPFFFFLSLSLSLFSKSRVLTKQHISDPSLSVSVCLTAHVGGKLSRRRGRYCSEGEASGDGGRIHGCLKKDELSIKVHSSCCHCACRQLTSVDPPSFHFRGSADRHRPPRLAKGAKLPAESPLNRPLHFNKPSMKSWQRRADKHGELLCRSGSLLMTTNHSPSLTAR